MPREFLRAHLRWSPRVEVLRGLIEGVVSERRAEGRRPVREWPHVPRRAVSNDRTSGRRVEVRRVSGRLTPTVRRAHQLATMFPLRPRRLQPDGFEVRGRRRVGALFNMRRVEGGFAEVLKERPLPFGAWMELKCAAIIQSRLLRSHVMGGRLVERRRSAGGRQERRLKRRRSESRPFGRSFG